MATVAELLTRRVNEAALAAGFGEALAALPAEAAVPCKDPEHGDYQSNLAFRLAKPARFNPRAVAQAIVDQLPIGEVFAAVSVAGPGFLNLRLTDAWLAADLAARAADPRLGAPSPGEGRTLVIDYSSPNIAKRMHVGHMRSTVIGNALDRLQRFLGWRVIADNHLGDWGTQFGKLIVGWHGWRDDAAFAADPIGELQRIYQAFGPKADADPELLDRARAETVKLQEGDPENRALWERFVAASMEEFDRVYDRFGVKFDVVHGESHYRDAVQPLVERLMASGLAVEDDGAIVIPFTPEDGKGLGDVPLLVRKRDGAALYGTTDLATVEARMAAWKPDLIAYVTDVRQQLHFKQVFAAARKMGHSPEFVHVWFGMLRFADGSIAATRSADSAGPINLIDVLDTAVARARAVVDEKSAHLPEAERAAIAEAVGVGAVRYADLSQNPQSDITFEWDKMLSLEGNTAPYLMYAYARCQSILRKAAEQGFSADLGALALVDPAERSLALTLARTPEALVAAGEQWRPNLVCDHAWGVANAFATFYNRCRVLDAAQPPETTAARLALTEATSRVLAVCMRLIGLVPLDRM